MKARRVIQILASACTAAICLAQQPQTDPMQLLIQVRHKVAQGISHIPRYLCTESVEREKLRLPSGVKQDLCPEILEAFANPSRRFRVVSADRLRLDVAVIDKREIYSWVGEGRFGDQSLSQLVNSGLTSTGSFGAFLNAIFATPSATFSYRSESQTNGRRVLEYAFRVRLLESDYELSNSRIRQIVPYSGSFTVDAETLDLLKIEIHADDIPSEMRFCQVSTQMDYAKLRLNDLDFMLPSEATTRVLSSDGTLAVNRTVFSGCHQFLGESKLLFDDPSVSAASPAEAKQKLTGIPAGLTFYIGLTQRVDPTKFSAGDLIKGALAKPVEIPDSHVTLPKGTLLNGRICELLMEYGDLAELQFGIKWESIEIGGERLPLRLALESAIPGTAKTAEVNVNISQLADFGAQVDQTVGYLSFPFVKKTYQIPAAFQSRWVSLTSVVK